MGTLNENISVRRTNLNFMDLVFRISPDKILYNYSYLDWMLKLLTDNTYLFFYYIIIKH